MHEWRPARPASLSGYLEAMTRVIMAAGINWKVVEAKWDGIREAFAAFDVQKVADMNPEDVDRLVADPRVIRNRRKIEAIIDNAAAMVELDAAFGGFDKYLRAHESYEETVAALRKDFKFLGESSAYFFLASVAEPVPGWKDVHHAR